MSNEARNRARDENAASLAIAHIAADLVNEIDGEAWEDLRGANRWDLTQTAISCFRSRRDGLRLQKWPNLQLQPTLKPDE